MCLRCGVVDPPYRSWPSGPAGSGDDGSLPDRSPPEYGAAPTGGLFGIGAPGRDYRMTTGRWDRGRAIGGNILTKLHIIRSPVIDASGRCRQRCTLDSERLFVGMDDRLGRSEAGG
jgi:hypothetical protein